MPRRPPLRTVSRTFAPALAPLALAPLAIGGAVSAQPPAGERPSRRAPPDPLMTALDVDADGTLSDAEIANAAARLLALDKDGDGRLAGQEVRRGGGRGRGRGPGGPGMMMGRRPTGPAASA